MNELPGHAGYAGSLSLVIGWRGAGCGSSISPGSGKGAGEPCGTNETCSSCGRWTLMWSNLKGGRAEPWTEIPWARATNTLPLTTGVLGADLEQFVV
jgi:hypothetical protein